MLKDKDVDILALGCTHYPYVIPVIKRILRPTVTIIDFTDDILNQLDKILRKSNLNKKEKGKTNYFTTKDVSLSSTTASMLLNKEVKFKSIR